MANNLASYAKLQTLMPTEASDSLVAANERGVLVQKLGVDFINDTTHDIDMALSWIEELNEKQLKRLLKYVDTHCMYDGIKDLGETINRMFYKNKPHCVIEDLDYYKNWCNF